MRPNIHMPNIKRINLLADAVRKTRCRSTDCKSLGTIARKCSVFTF